MNLKRIKYLNILAIIIIELFFFNNVFAQSLNTSDKLNIKLTSGINIAVSDYISTGSGGNILLGADYWFPKNRKSNLGFGFEVGLKTFKGKGNNLGLPELFKTKSFTVGFAAKYQHLLVKDIAPYIGLGVSFYRFSFSDKNIYSKIIKQANGGKNNSLSFDTQIGMNYILSDIITLNFETGLHFIFNDNLDAIKIGNHNDYFADFNIGISYNLFSKKDSDNDGIFDEDDKCPNVAEDLDGFEDDDGCPDLDNDKDGIPDDVDLCVNLPEDLDGFEDEDGCPDIDNDKDGIEDINDRCPNKAEDFDGFKDTDGCPDLDNDDDGILDVNDKCPNKAENKNGYQDEDGCPDVIPFDESKLKAELEKLNIPPYFILNADQTFDRNTNNIKNTAIKKLEKIVKIMKQNPKIFWRIEGHVEKQKSHLEAIKKAKILIVAVRKYLISRGVSPDNLQISAIGDSAPIASNNTVFGRMKNRRIKIIRIN
jgi:outer membrane protein OmpA-like peptidoglycan-associated protein